MNSLLTSIKCPVNALRKYYKIGPCYAKIWSGLNVGSSEKWILWDFLLIARLLMIAAQVQLKSCFQIGPLAISPTLGLIPK